jgi:hypothetical protein
MVVSEEAKERRRIQSKEHKQEWRKTHKELNAQRLRDQYLKNKEARNATSREWYVNNREKCLELVR